MNRRLRFGLAPVAAFLALSCAPAVAQPPGGAYLPIGESDGERPRVCLVLSGGGARGAAHLGVLTVLEEMRIPIDCIAGTSMGAVIGAGYASGMTIPEMEKLAAAITVDSLFHERPPREEWSIRRKRDDYRNLFGVEIGVSDDAKFQFAKGVVSGVQLETVLRKLSRVKGAVEFDRLPIPFRAVATDLVTGKPKVFDKGDLALVMRASMSVPGLVAPAEFDGMMLVDGGLVNNLPVDVARRMGADVVIAVNLGTPLARREQIRDILGITGQMIAILTEQNVQETLTRIAPTDILILPELGDFSAADFDHMAKTYPIGEAATRKVADRLAALAVSPDRYLAFQRERTTPIPPDLRPVDELQFAKSRVGSAYAESVLSTHVGTPIDQATLDRDLRRLYGTDNYEHVSYQIIDTPAKRILNVEAVDKSWGPNYMRFGLGLSSDFSGNAYFNLLGQYRRTWINELGGEWRTDAVLGRNSELTTELYQPLDPRHRWFVAPRLSYQRAYLSIWADGTRVSDYAFPTGLANLDLGMNFTYYGELRAGVFGGVTRPDHLSGVPIPGDTESSTVAGVRLSAYFDQLDNLYFPKQGWVVQADLLKSFKSMGSDVEYDQYDLQAVVAHTWDRHTMQGAIRAVGPLSSTDGVNFLSVPWGGFLQQSGFSTGELLNERIVFGRLVYNYKVIDVPLLQGLYAGLSAEAGYYGDPIVQGNPKGMLYSGSAFLAFDSPIGPLYLGYGVGTGGNRSAYFFLGRP